MISRDVTKLHFEACLTMYTFGTAYCFPVIMLCCFGPGKNLLTLATTEGDKMKVSSLDYFLAG